MDKDKLKQFKGLSEEYLEKVARTYDERNRGSYFHYDWKINRDNKGITWDNGGEKLIKNGRDLVSRSMVLYSPEFQRLYHQIEEIRESNNYVKAPLIDVMHNLGFLTSSLRGIESRESDFDCDSSFDLYSHMKGFSMYGGVEDIPMEYIWKLGEMVFHQIRIEEISHACEGSTHWTCRNLDEVLQEMHVSYFEDKKHDFGEALVRELLSVHYDLSKFSGDQPLPAMQAQNAIRRYRITNEDLITAADESLVLQAQKYIELASQKRKTKQIKEEHDMQRKRVLDRIGIKPYNS
ncbi:hypothetical protein HZA33_01165 [Candidatus Pacearchaeota archaeon]|nr:hypothetical protein [Candidatus Pacearchaeota archaeon]